MAEHQTRLAECQALVDEAQRGKEDAEQRLAALARAHEDERTRSALQLKLAADKAASTQQRVREQAQALYANEELLRAREAEISRLRIEQDGASTLISSFQGRLEECAKVIESTGKAEQECRAAFGNVREEQATLRAQLDACREAQRAAVPREQLERRLRAALHDAAGARAVAKERSLALRSRGLQIDEAKAQLARGAATLQEQQRLGAAAHARELEGEARNKKLTEVRCARAHPGRRTERAPAPSPGASGPPTAPAATPAATPPLPHRSPARPSLAQGLNRALKANLQSTDKHAALMRKLQYSTTVRDIFAREIGHADANAHGASLHAGLAAEGHTSAMAAADTRLASKVTATHSARSLVALSHARSLVCPPSARSRFAGRAAPRRPG